MDAQKSEKLVHYLLNLKYEEIPPEVLSQAKLCVLDTLGIALAGSLTPLGKIVRGFAVGQGGKEETTIFNYGDRISAVLAAYANGTMAFCYNFTDTTLSCVVHCGPAIIPAALAMAEREGSTGKEFLAAVIVGYEMMTRVGNAINSGLARMNHHKSGFHATGTTGAFGTCLTASRLLGLTLDRGISALGIAGSYASGILSSLTCPESESWKTHTGIAAQNGITAALLAQMGLKGPAAILEGKNGFLQAFGRGRFDVEKLDENLGKKFLITDSSFKLYNCAHVWANPLDTLKRICETYHLQPEDVAEIKVIVPTMYTYVMASSTEKKYPRNYAEAENNPYYLMAAMALHRRVSVEQFEDHVLRDPRMKEMTAKVNIQVEPSLDAIFQGTDKAPAQVRIVLARDHKEISDAADYPRGSPKNPVTQMELENKFIDLAAKVFNKDRVLEIIHLISGLEKQNHLTDLVKCLTA